MGGLAIGVYAVGGKVIALQGGDTHNENVEAIKGLLWRLFG